jgi:hypothetical protein
MTLHASSIAALAGATAMLFLAACDTAPETTGSGGSENVCAPGAQVACACVGGTTGAQVCKADGSGYEACQCPEPTSTSSTGGQGGAGGQGGIGGGSGAGGGPVCSPGSQQPCYTGPPGTESIGLCTVGTQTCHQDGTGYGPCMGEVTPQPESCDTPMDEDCDGAVDEDCACVPGSVEECYTGPAGTEGVGACLGGMHLCEVDGTGYGPCVGEITPQAETCDTPADDDCDGTVNEDGAGCVCAPGTSTTCYTGPTGTLGVGVCTGGMKTCNTQGTAYGACLGEVTPGVENCATSEDESCDGSPGPCAVQPWSKGFASNGSYPIALAVGPSGELVVGSRFTGSIDFGGGPLVSQGNGFYAFAVKYDAAGNHVWSNAFGSPLVSGEQIVKAVAIDPLGNVFLAGEFEGSIDLGGGSLVSAGQRDVFLAKLTSSGQHVWSKRFGAAQADFADDVAVDPTGNVVLLGKYGDLVDFGGGSILTNQAVLVQLTAAGAFAWSRPLVSYLSGWSSVALDASGNLLSAGGFNNTVDFGGGPLSAPGDFEIYAAKLGAAGNHVYSKKYGSSNPDGAHDVAADGQGNLLMTGEAYPPTNFGPGPMTGNIFATKLDATGNTVFAKDFGGVGSNNVGRGIAADAMGNVLVIGDFMGSTIDLGGGPFQNPSTVYSAMYIGKLSPTGAHLSSATYKGVGANGSASGMAIEDAGNGHAAVVGRYAGTLDLGSGALPNVLDGIFIARVMP